LVKLSGGFTAYGSGDIEKRMKIRLPWSNNSIKATGNRPIAFLRG
jgi:hypothetical protein